MLLLASASPRRADLLRRLGLAFEVSPALVDETPPQLPVAEAVVAVATRKAEAARRAHNGKSRPFILAADTAVVLADEWLGKPRDAAEAREMLHRLSGREHLVVTGVAVVSPREEQFTGAATTRVEFDSLSKEQVEAYVATGEPLDKAGAYGIQGAAAAFVRRVDGDYSNVVGLPIRLALHLLHRAGYPLPPHLTPSYRNDA